MLWPGRRDSSRRAGRDCNEVHLYFDVAMRTRSELMPRREGDKAFRSGREGTGPAGLAIERRTTSLRDVTAAGRRYGPTCVISARSMKIITTLPLAVGIPATAPAASDPRHMKPSSSHCKAR